MKEFLLKKTSSRDNSIDVKFLHFVVKSLWERSVKRVRGKTYTPNGVMFIDGNIGLSDLQEHLPDAVISKLHLNFTGKQPLNHPDEVELVERMLLNGKEMFKVIIFLIFLFLGG